MLGQMLRDFLSIALELTVLFIGVSFLVSILQGLIPYEKLNRYLSGKNTYTGVSAAIIFAFITPFCSCSTIPIVVNLLHKQVRFGIVMIFLFASPVLDPIILSLMAALLGWKVAVVYTLVTSVLSIIIGLSLERLGFEKAVKRVRMTGYQEPKSRFSLSYAARETLNLMKTVYPFLLIGAGIGAVIHGAVPTEWMTTHLGGDKWWLVPIAAIIGIPLYIRLSTMIPLSQILIAKGMAFPPVMALMIASTGASLPEVALLNSIFQKRLVSAFVVAVVFMASVSGFLFYLI
ncbi:permease [Robertmurraya sp. DFI.2.37]|uniref:permease n=1 Tax=Robertmurraya sp. DFI.2.37 TaxID=3031819 RepID=UPI0023DC490B|nr:permease [Robertmurraya sp. DFI.2.37]MDF1510144.1 permease [Robertmurraya sp. DFI.2.37]